MTNIAYFSSMSPQELLDSNAVAVVSSPASPWYDEEQFDISQYVHTVPPLELWKMIIICPVDLVQIHITNPDKFYIVALKQKGILDFRKSMSGRGGSESQCQKDGWWACSKSQCKPAGK